MEMFLGITGYWEGSILYHSIFFYIGFVLIWSLRKLPIFLRNVLEIICYNYLYKIKWINGTPFSDAYKLNYYHNYDPFYDELILDCHRCTSYNEELKHGNDSAAILKCGHAFHHRCLRRYERNQYANSMLEPYRCPVNGCNRMYHWRRGKWHYPCTENRKIFNEIRDETLLRYLPSDIENVLIDFIN